MSTPTWITPPGDLGVVPEGRFYQLTFKGYDVDNESNPVYFQLIAGSLPAGMQLRKNGLIEGIPRAFASFQGTPAEVGSNITSKFAVRLYTEKPDGSIDRINDRTFTITITGQDIPTFTVPSGLLGYYYDGTLVDVIIGSEDPDPNDIVSYYISSGSLPNGLHLDPDGHIRGYIIPNVDAIGAAIAGYDRDGTEYDQHPFDFTTHAISKNYQFIVAITDGKQTNVRSYSMFVYARDAISADTTDITADNDFVTADQAKYRSPFITNPAGFIGTYRHDNWFAYKFNGIDFDGDIIKYELTLGDGTTFDSDNVGFDAPGIGFDANASDLPPGLILDPLTGWLYGRIPSLNFLEKDYSFAITVSKLMDIDIDALNLSWKTPVFAATVENIVLAGEQIIDGTSVTDGKRVLVKNQNLAQNNGIYIVRTGAWERAPDMDQILPFNEYRSAAVAVTNGFANGNSAWTQSANVSNPGVSVIAFTRFIGVTEKVSSDFYHYTLRIIGDVEKEVQWTTLTDLGVAYNGDVSMFSVNAISRSGYTLYYRLYTGVKSRLPQGTTLLSDGSISGRITFNTFGMDSGNTTFDKDYNTRLGKKETTFDNEFTFTVEAYDAAGLISTYKEFSIKVVRKYKEPYENMYLQAMPSLANRDMIGSMLQNEDVIPYSLLYRPLDPYFGRAVRVETLFLHGLRPSTSREYAESLFRNAYEKKLWLGSIKTARALDKYGKIVYEVVYSTLVDDLMTIAGESTGKMQMLPFHVDTTDGPTHWVYPNSILNMQKQMSETIEQIAPSALPLWMTSKQASGVVLGYTPAWVICYTKPNESEKIAYRLRQKYSQELNKIYFTVNRLVSDMTLSEHYDKAMDHWERGQMITFDRSDRPSGISFAMQVDFATDMPFAALNSKTPAQIFAAGGIDGVFTEYAGRTIIFLNQEHYEDWNMTINDGWVDYNSAMDETGQGYDTHNFDEYTVIPDDGLHGQGITNLRLGVFRFVKENGIYHLEHVRNFDTTDYVQILYGKSYVNNEFFIPHAPAPGQMLITWRHVQHTQRKETTFDASGTRFIEPVDMYSGNKNSKMKYIPFPKHNILG